MDMQKSEIEVSRGYEGLDYAARLGRQMDLLLTRELKDKTNIRSAAEIREAFASEPDFGKEAGIKIKFEYSEDGNEVVGVSLSEKVAQGYGKVEKEIVEIKRNAGGQFEKVSSDTVSREDLVRLQKELAVLLDETREKQRVHYGSSEYQRLMILVVVVSLLLSACGPAVSATPEATMTQPAATATLERPTVTPLPTLTPIPTVTLGPSPQFLPDSGGGTPEPATPEATKEARYKDITDIEGNVHHVRLIKVDGNPLPFGDATKDFAGVAEVGFGNFRTVAVSGFFGGELVRQKGDGYWVKFYVIGPDGKAVPIWLDTYRDKSSTGEQHWGSDEKDPYSIYSGLVYHAFTGDLVNEGMGGTADEQGVVVLLFPETKADCVMPPEAYKDLGKDVAGRIEADSCGSIGKEKDLVAGKIDPDSVFMLWGSLFPGVHDPNWKK